MRIEERLEAVVRVVTRRPLITVTVVLVLALGGGALALGLKPSAQTDTFVGKSTSSYRASEADYRHFGGNAVIVLMRGPLKSLLESRYIGNMMQFEGCLAGQRVVLNQQQTGFVVNQKAGPLGGRNGPCGQLERMHAVQVVFGPATFLSRAASALTNGIKQLETQIQSSEQTAAAQAQAAALKAGDSAAVAKQKGEQAGEQAAASQLQSLIATAQQDGLNASSLNASIGNPNFVGQVVFGSSSSTTPKGRFAYLFPNSRSALIQVRLKSSLSTQQQARVIKLIREAVKLKYFDLGPNGSYTVTGEPVVISDLTAQITRSIVILLIAAVAVMAVTLLIVFRSRWRREPARARSARPGAAGEAPAWMRLLPLVTALAAAGITFGIIALAGVTLTMASIAVLPVLIGLGVDYAIQFQSRAQEALRDGGGSATASVSRAARTGGPTIAVAALATGVGFLVLLLSPVPMVRGFGLLLVLGIAVALVCAFTGGAAAQVALSRGLRTAGEDPDLVAASGRWERMLGPSLRGAGEILGDAARAAGRLLSNALVGAGELFSDLAHAATGPLRRTRWGRPAREGGRGSAAGLGNGIVHTVVGRPGVVLAIGAALAIAGWVADTQTAVQSDVTKLVPTTMPALRDLRQLEQVTGTSGEIDVTVHANDVASAKVIDWMIRYENRLLKHYGYTEAKGCAKVTLCPALSLPDLFSTGTSGSTSSSGLTDAGIQQLLAAVPNYFKRAVITSDRQNAALAFGIRLLPLAKQQQVIDYMRSQLHPPAGVSAQLAGLPVLAAQANQALSSSSRRLLTLLAGLAAVGLVLLAVFRSLRRALVPLVPIALATGWSALILYAIGIPLNPMSATLGALVIAISTEFSVLLSERFRQEQHGGGDLVTRLQRTYRSTGAAVAASGVTAIAGFGVLVFSNITMLRDFGFVTLIDLSASLLGVLIVLPAVLTLAQPGGALGSRPLRDRLAPRPPRLRRRATA